LSLDPEATTLSKGETASAQTAPCQQPLTQRLNDTRQTQKKKTRKDDDDDDGGVSSLIHNPLSSTDKSLLLSSELDSSHT
jgi:hypothetical protein